MWPKPWRTLSRLYRSPWFQQIASFAALTFSWSTISYNTIFAHVCSGMFSTIWCFIVLFCCCCYFPFLLLNRIRWTIHECLRIVVKRIQKVLLHFFEKPRFLACNYYFEKEHCLGSIHSLDLDGTPSLCSPNCRWMGWTPTWTVRRVPWTRHPLATTITESGLRPSAVASQKRA